MEDTRCDAVQPLIEVQELTKVYESGFKALSCVDLTIRDGEIFALLGPNGAGKTTLISIICGIVTPSDGQVTVAGYNVINDYRETRSRIGLVPQEIAVDSFESVLATVTFSRGLFGKKPDPALIEKVLRDVSLWDKKDNPIMSLSGGMKRRVMIAKALSHEPEILFLDEPTAGVDVELRREMWEVIHNLRETGVTVILTTHYIEEAEEMADRVGVINTGEIILVDDKTELLRKMGQKTLTLELHEPLSTIPATLDRFNLALSDSGDELLYTYDTRAQRTGISALLAALSETSIRFRDLRTTQSSLEDIFVNLVNTSD